MKVQIYLIDGHDNHVLQLLPSQAQPRQANLTCPPMTPNTASPWSCVGMTTGKDASTSLVYSAVLLTYPGH